MKRLSILLKLTPVALIASCGLQQELSDYDSVGYDPLSAPGSNRARQAAQQSEQSTADAIVTGSLVSAAIPDTSFFTTFPNRSSKPSSVLARGTALEVIENKGAIYKVKQVESGVEGFVVASAVTTEVIEIEPIIEEPNTEDLALEFDPLSEDLVTDPITSDPLAGVKPDDGIAPGTVLEDTVDTTIENTVNETTLPDVEDIIVPELKEVVPE